MKHIFEAFNHPKTCVRSIVWDGCLLLLLEAEDWDTLIEDTLHLDEAEELSKTLS
jgi:hypothetical protein